MIEYFLLAGIFGLSLYMIDTFICNTVPDPIIVVLDIDGSLTTVPGEYRHSAFSIPTDDLSNSSKNTYLFGDLNKKHKIIIFLNVLSKLKERKLIDIAINSNNYENRIELLFADLGINMNQFINKKLSKMTRWGENLITKGACLIAVRNAYPKSKIIFFEDDKIYLPQIPVDIVWINCDSGNRSLPYLINNEFTTNITEQNVYNWLKELKN